MVDPKDMGRENFVMDNRHPGAAAADSTPDSVYAADSNVFNRKSMIPFIIGGLGLVILVILVSRLFSVPQNTVDPDFVQSLETRISDLENQLLKRNELDQAIDRIEQQEFQMNSIGQKLNRFESTVSTQIDQIIKEIGILHQTRMRVPSAATPKPRATADAQPTASPKPGSTPGRHMVQSGDTLYRISRRYGLTVDQLRNYNNLAPDAAIYPGQQLKLQSQ